MTLKEAILRAEHEGWDVEPEWADGFNAGLARAVEIVERFLANPCERKAGCPARGCAECGQPRPTCTQSP